MTRAHACGWEQPKNRGTPYIQHTAPIPALVLCCPLQAVKVEYANVPQDIKQDWEDGVKFLGVRESFHLYTSKLTLKQFCCVCGEGGRIIYCNNETCGLPYCTKCLSELVVPDWGHIHMFKVLACNTQACSSFVLCKSLLSAMAMAYVIRV
jgi:hypothetical protein